MLTRTFLATFVAMAIAISLPTVMADEPETGRGAAPRVTDASQQITNSIGMKLTLIPPGKFMMGSAESAESKAEFFKENYLMGLMTADRFENEHPQHRVRITRPFYMGIYHVTRGQFREFVEATGYQTFVEKGEGFMPGTFGFDIANNMYGFIKDCSWRSPGYEQTDEHPAVIVEWIDAAAFCEWLSKKEGKAYRLPTEAEWEYACRAGTTTRYHSGDDPESLTTVANVADALTAARFERFAWALKASDGYVFTSPTGRFQPNAFGLYDMHGSAWQWCSDWYKPDYYAESPVDDPAGPGDGYRSREAHVARGGSWYSRPWECTSSSRHWLGPASRDCDQAGFRVVLCVDPSDDPVKRAAAKRPPIADGVQVSIERINNQRYGDRHVVEIQLKITGPLVAETKAMRTFVFEASDDEGHPLPMPDSQDGFQPFGGSQIYLTAPGPVKTVKVLRGEVDLLVPARDPESVVTINFAKEAGAPVNSAVLKAAVAEITFDELQGPSEEAGARQEWSVSYLIKDPYGRIVGDPEFVDRDGRTIPTSTPYGGGSGGTRKLTVVFRSMPPEDCLVKFQVATDKSMVAVPFEFEDVPVARPSR
ncbi:MAG: formylglycine-generating enzyme family protein [Pirellulales bacterium]